MKTTKKKSVKIKKTDTITSSMKEILDTISVNNTSEAYTIKLKTPAASIYRKIEGTLNDLEQGQPINPEIQEDINNTMELINSNPEYQAMVLSVFIGGIFSFTAFVEKKG